VGPVILTDCENPFIGMIEDSEYHSESLDVHPGDRFVLYTDGLVEIGEDKAEWMESHSRLLEATHQHRSLPLAELPLAIVRSLGAENPDDDVAVMVVEV
jgi:serine phosphatase RsbU (regulator of sigma subunit)